MKLFAVVLALVAFSGCHGRMLPQDEAWSAWETAVGRVTDYFSDLNSKADRVVQDLQQTQIARELNTLTQDTLAELAVYRDNLNSNVAPYTQERAEQLARDLQKLGEDLRVNMVSAGERAAEYGQDVQGMMQQSAADFSTTFNAYARKIRKRVAKEQFNKKAAAYVEQLQSITAEHAQNIQSQMEPYLTQVRDNAQDKLSTINRLLSTQAGEVAGSFLSSAEQFRERADKTAEKLRSTVEDKVEELRDWFTENTAMFRE